MLRKMLLKISTHTSHAGRDSISKVCLLARSIFLLTRPMRGATNRSSGLSLFGVISTHTPHAGRDMIMLTQTELLTKFLLTRLLRGATKLICRA